jgi:peptide/nickel transport system ATP-binding protein
LLRATVLGSEQRRRLEAAIAGAPPGLSALPPGCAFAPRCRFADDRCRAVRSPEFTLAPGHNTHYLRVTAGEIELAAARALKLIIASDGPPETLPYLSGIGARYSALEQ